MVWRTLCMGGWLSSWLMNIEASAALGTGADCCRNFEASAALGTGADCRRVRGHRGAVPPRDVGGPQGAGGHPRGGQRREGTAELHGAGLEVLLVERPEVGRVEGVEALALRCQGS